MRPVIGVIPLVDEERESYWMVPGYLEGIRQAGGLPVVLPFAETEGELAQLDAMCDGYLLTGGHDVDPALYGEAKSPLCGPPCEARDRLEKRLFARAYAEDKAVFGICRGLQLLNVLMGGTLYQDLPEQFYGSADTHGGHHMTPPYDRAFHRVFVDEGTPLFRLLGKRELGVNSYHHQGIRRLADGLGLMARAEDGLAEAVYVPDRTFIWAVQWHPEFRCGTDEDSRKLFAAFVEGCRAAGKKKAENLDKEYGFGW